MALNTLVTAVVFQCHLGQPAKKLFVYLRHQHECRSPLRFASHEHAAETPSTLSRSARLNKPPPAILIWQLAEEEELHLE